MINAVIVYRSVTGSSICRRKYILELLKQLQKINDKNGESESDSDSDDQPAPKKRKYCQIRRCKENKTNFKCTKCKKYVCGKCSGKVQKNITCTNCQSKK